MTLTEIKEKYEEGDPQGFKNLQSRYIYLIKKAGSKYYSKINDREDLEQLALIGIWRGLKLAKGKDENEIRNNIFYRYRQTMGLMAARERTVSRGSRISVNSLETITAPQVEDSAEAVVMKVAIEQFLNRLDEKKRKMIKLHAVGYSCLEVGEKVGVSATRVSWVIKKAREAFKKEI